MNTTIDVNELETKTPNQTGALTMNTTIDVNELADTIHHIVHCLDPNTVSEPLGHVNFQALLLETLWHSSHRCTASFCRAPNPSSPPVSYGLAATRYPDALASLKFISSLPVFRAAVDGAFFPFPLPSHHSIIDYSAKSLLALSCICPALSVVFAATHYIRCTRLPSDTINARAQYFADVYAPSLSLAPETAYTLDAHALYTLPRFTPPFARPDLDPAMLRALNSQSHLEASANV
jgi:hypothetical protein